MERGNRERVTIREGLDFFRRRWPDVRSGSEESPIFLMAAAYRTGSTLLQRMLSRECLMWGEPYGHGGFLQSVTDLFRRFRSFWPEEAFFFRDQGTESRTQEFIANLYPSPQVLIDSYLLFFDSLFSRPARDAGLERWGMKTVRLSADHAFLFRFLYPKAKFLFLVRNPDDAFRSYDTIRRKRHVQWFHRWPDQPVTAAEFGRHWRELTASYLEHFEELDARVIYYEHLLRGQVDLDELESYLGVRIDQDAMKVNPGGWPVSRGNIDERERDAFFAEVQGLAESLGYLHETIDDLAQGEGNAPPVSAAPASVASPGAAGTLDDLFQEAMALQQQGDSEEAYRKCRAILNSDARHAGAWHLLGLIAFSGGDYSAACDYIAEALRLCNTKPVYHNNYGAVLLEIGRLPQARDAFQNAIRLNRDYADAWSNLGRAEQLLGRPIAETERSFSNALALQPGHPDALLHLADLYRNHGRLDESMRLCREYLGRYPGDVEALTKLGKSLALAKRFDEAVAALEGAVAGNPTDPQLHLALGTLHGDQEQIDGARLAFGHAADLRPDKRIWRWRHLGLCPTVFRDQESIDCYWDALHEELDRALSESISLDWKTLPHDGFTSPFNLPHHNRCCRGIKEKFASLFQHAFPHTVLKCIWSSSSTATNSSTQYNRMIPSSAFSRTAESISTISTRSGSSTPRPW